MISRATAAEIVAEHDAIRQTETLLSAVDNSTAETRIIFIVTMGGERNDFGMEREDLIAILSARIEQRRAALATLNQQALQEAGR